MKRISVALCVDDDLGMMFYGRRQSRDRVLIAEFMEWCGERTVCIAKYSKLLFENYPQVRVCEDPLTDCPDGGVCFLEDRSFRSHLPEVGEWALYHWNRRYPGDLHLDVNPEAEGFCLVSVKEFEGSSHENIKKEVYQK